MLGVSSLALFAGFLATTPVVARGALVGDPPGDRAADTRHVRHDGTHGTDPRTKPSSDTVAKGEKGKDHAVPQVPTGGARKKALKPRMVAPPAESTPQGRQAPDRPWETTFLVNNTSFSTLWQFAAAGGAREYR